MVYGAVIRAPVEGSGPDQVDDRKAKAVAGVLDIVRLPYGVGVLAQTSWAAFAARQALLSGVTWKRTGTAWGLDSDQAVESFAAAARNLGAEASDWDKQGDARSELAKTAVVVEADYRCDYAYHAQMEPLNATALISPAGDAAEIWCGTQSQTMAQEAVAKVLGIPRDKVKLHDLLLGGGFGRRGHRDEEFIIDAVLMAKAAGKPVKVMWTREDDVHNGRMRPLSAHHLRAGLDASGKLVAWHHRIAGDRVLPYADPVRFERGGRKAGIAEVSVERASGRIKVHNFWCTIDCGIAVQPDNVMAQSESSIVYGLGMALMERISYKDGAVEQNNFYDYRVPRMNEIPAMHV